MGRASFEGVIAMKRSFLGEVWGLALEAWDLKARQYRHASKVGVHCGSQTWLQILWEASILPTTSTRIHVARCCGINDTYTHVFRGSTWVVGVLPRKGAADGACICDILQLRSEMWCRTQLLVYYTVSPATSHQRYTFRNAESGATIRVNVKLSMYFALSLCWGRGLDRPWCVERAPNLPPLLVPIGLRSVTLMELKVFIVCLCLPDVINPISCGFSQRKKPANATFSNLTHFALSRSLHASTGDTAVTTGFVGSASPCVSHS